MAKKLRSRIRAVVSDILKPPPQLNLVEWADEYRYLSRESSAEPGRWETSRVEVARGPMMAVTDPRVHTVTVMCCTQLMKTELINNILGYYVHLDPSPIIVMQPTEKLAKAWSHDRLSKMIRDSEVLREAFGADRSRDASNTTLHKEFPGGHVSIVGANAPSDLASRPIRIVLCDETDKYPASAGKEGDPIKLVSERTATFWNALKVHTCSPTIEGRSRIAYEYEQSDQRIYEVPCPHCKTYQEMQWERVKWEKDKPETAKYYCEHCTKPWKESQRLKAIQKGNWRATKPFKGHAGFKVNKLASPWEPLSKIADKFLAAKKDPEKLKVFVNTQLAETWKEKGESPDWTRLYERRERYEMGTLEKGILFLTAGVDVQDQRLEVEVVGWGRDKQSWSVQEYIFPGDTAQAGVWQRLDELLNETWEDQHGNQLPLSVMAVDSGFRTQTVYSWCKKYPLTRVIPVKGSDKQHILINTGSLVDVTMGRVRRARSHKVFTIGVSVAKTELYGWLRLPKPLDGESYPAGYCHFPEYGEEFFKQLTAEQQMKKVIRGKPAYIWQKVYERNEALDRRIYARAAASYFGLDRYKEHHWNQLEEQLGKNSVKTSKQIQKSVKITRRPSTFL